MDLDNTILERLYPEPENTLTDDWEMPDNWQDFNQSRAAYAFLRSPQDQYKGDSNTPMFIIKPNFSRNPYCRQTVFEDGHVECVSKKEAIKLWKKAGVWNE